MQNKPNSMKQFWKDNGYYILLGLCVVAVGVSGYFFVSGALQEKEQVREVLSIPATVEEPAKEQTKPAQTPTKTPVTEQPAAPETPTAAEAPQVVLPVSGEVLQDHAMDHLIYHETTRDWRVHNGVDLAAEPGQPVKAARAGTVAAVYEDDFYGVTVVLDHGDGYTSHSCNLAENVPVAAGDTVTAGQTIGMVGATALIESASPGHLHFEVYRDGTPMDPAGFLY